MSIDLDQFEHNIIHPDTYARHGYPHEVWTKLRAEEPVCWWDKTDGLPFWAITKHEDIIEISKQPEKFINGPRITISHEPEPPPSDDPMANFPPTLIQMDNPQHSIFRELIAKRFTPRYLKSVGHDVEVIGKEIVDNLLEKSEGGEGECDFVAEVSAPLPIAVIGWLLGVPKEDWPMLFDWTNAIIGAGDPEYNVGDMDPVEQGRAKIVKLFTYYAKLIEEKEKNPDDALVSHINAMRVDGKPLELMDKLSWCLIITVAGNETTRNATSGGMLGLIEHQSQLRKCQQDMSLLPGCIEEMIRWATPIIHFAREATCDYELRGKTIKKGDALALFYPSANRDEEIFEDPFDFRIDRNPNRHLSFGIGEHFCVGSHLARMEMIVAYRHLIPRLQEVELAGPPERLWSSLVGGVKHLPIRYKVSAA